MQDYVTAKTPVCGDLAASTVWSKCCKQVVQVKAKVKDQGHKVQGQDQGQEGQVKVWGQEGNSEMTAQDQTLD